MKRIVFLALGVLLIAGCASRPTAPESEIGAARSALTSASDAGAVSNAREAYQDARDQLERAERALASEEFVLSRRLAVEATAKARLAAVSARANQTIDLISELQMSNDELRSEIQAATEAMTAGDMR